MIFYRPSRSTTTAAGHGDVRLGRRPDGVGHLDIVFDVVDAEHRKRAHQHLVLDSKAVQAQGLFGPGPHVCQVAGERVLVAAAAGVGGIDVHLVAAVVVVVVVIDDQSCIG